MRKINVNIHKFTEQFNKEYKFLYDNHDNVCGYGQALEEGDNFIKNPKNKEFIGEFCKFRQDFISSDREVVAFMFALETLGYL